MPLPFTSLPTAISELQLIQDRIAAAFKQFSDRAEFDTVLIENVALTAGSINNIEHTLGRAVRGWYLVRQNTNCIVYENTATTDSSQLSLIPTANCIVSLVVF